MSREFCHVVVPPSSTECLSPSNLRLMTTSLFSMSDEIIQINLCWLSKTRIELLCHRVNVGSEGRAWQGWGQVEKGLFGDAVLGRSQSFPSRLKMNLCGPGEEQLGISKMLLSFFPSQPS